MTIDGKFDGKFKAINVLYYLGDNENENIDKQIDDEYTIDECRLDGNWEEEIPVVFTQIDSSSFRQLLVNTVNPLLKYVVFIDMFETESQKNRAIEFFKTVVKNKSISEDVRLAIKNWYLTDTPCFRVLENIEDISEIPNMEWKLVEK